MKKDVDVSLIKQIIEDKNLTQKKFADIIGKDKQYVWMLLNEKRNISKETQNIIADKFPEYFSPETTVNIKYCPEIILPYSHDLNTKTNEYVSFDKRLLPDINGKPLNYSNCKIVTIGSDTLTPYFLKDTKVIIETGYTEFLNDHIFAFTFGNFCYIRRISINPENGQIKCISLNDKEDTFYIYSMDDKTQILGLIVPRIRL